MEVNDQLKTAGFQSFLVGGCVRDFLLGIPPKDWDITTNATPPEIQKLFPDSVYENRFGTVGVKTESEDPTLKIVEVTTFRKEGKYTDKRHPDDISFAKTVEEDLSRRDFTVNAMALAIATRDKKQETNIIDPYGGQADLKKKIIRAVGEPSARFQEDALRLMRAVRFAAQLNFKIEKETAAAVKKHAGLIEFVADERTADEFSKLLMTGNAAEGVRWLEEYGLLKYVVMELREGIEMGQNKHHIYTVFEHNVRSLEYAAKENFPLDLRMASLLHDVGKSRTKQGNGLDSTFYGHQVVGAKMALKILDRLHYPKKMIEKIVLLIREHMFVYDPEVVTLRGVRRLVSRVGEENVDDLLKVREADRIGSGVPKAQPYRLRYLKAMVEKIKKEPVSAKLLQINGTELMKLLKIEAGPKVGQILAVLLEDILDNPELNMKEELKKRALKLNELPEKELLAMRKRAQQAAENAQRRIDDEIKKKYFVK